MNIVKLTVIGASLLFSQTNAMAQQSLPSDVGVHELGAGHLFVNDAGFTLYTFKQDKQQPGTSVCIDECAVAWPPVLASDNAIPVGKWTLIKRQDDTPQWAYNGHPVYTYVKDTHPGAIVGEKASGFWDVLYEPVETPPDISIQASVLGQILTNPTGMTIYKETSGACDDACMKRWQPVEAPWMASPINDDWAITSRGDGLTQWSYKGQPLYTFKGDYRSGESNGQDAEGAWKVAVLQDPPQIPSWVTFQETDLGQVMANEDRMTLYYMLWDEERIKRETCGEECIRDNWDPVIAPKGAQPIANWSTAELKNGNRQWLYMGLPVFTFRSDKMPGDTYGDKFGTGSAIRGGWAAILRESLIQELSS